MSGLRRSSTVYQLGVSPRNLSVRGQRVKRFGLAAPSIRWRQRSTPLQTLAISVRGLASTTGQ